MSWTVSDCEISSRSLSSLQVGVQALIFNLTSPLLLQICYSVLCGGARARCPALSRSASVTMATAMDQTVEPTWLPKGNCSSQAVSVCVASHTSDDADVGTLVRNLHVFGGKPVLCSICKTACSVHMKNIHKSSSLYYFTWQKEISRHLVVKSEHFIRIFTFLRAATSYFFTTSFHFCDVTKLRLSSGLTRLGFGKCLGSSCNTGSCSHKYSWKLFQHLITNVWFSHHKTQLEMTLTSCWNLSCGVMLTNVETASRTVVSGSC